MSTTRKTFIELFDEHYNNNDKRNRAIEATRENIENKSQNQTRAFDHLDLLIDDNEVETLQTEFLAIFKKIKMIDKFDETKIDTYINFNNLNELLAWEKKIIDIGIKDFLNKNGKLRQEIISLMRWENIQHKLLPRDIVYSFVGGSIQAIQDKMVNIEDIKKDLDKNIIAFEIINLLFQKTGERIDLIFKNQFQKAYGGRTLVNTEEIILGSVNEKPDEISSIPSQNANSIFSTKNISYVAAVATTAIVGGFALWNNFRKSPEERRKNNGETEAVQSNSQFTLKNLNRN